MADLTVKNITTSMNVAKEIGGFKINATVEVYNNSKNVKSINATIRKSGTEPSMSSPSYTYTVTRGINSSMGGMGGMNTEVTEEQEQALEVGFAFEKIVEDMIATAQFNNQL